MTTLVFDIETIPDVDSGRRIYNLEGLTDREVAEVMFIKRRQDTGGNSDFLRHHLHRIIAISVVLATRDKLNVWSLGEAASGEAELIQRFFEGVEKYTPVLVSWNGHGFDLPVLHYRALLHGVASPRYWETGEDDQAFRWNNYLSRYHKRHTDLMDIISGYEYRAVAPLNEIAGMLGFPGKMGMDGGRVWDCYQNGEIEAIRNYCETDVLNTYLIYLRYEKIRGRYSESEHHRECERLKQMLRGAGRAHLHEFLRIWDCVAP
ncbi:MAG: 3'-5' exonuclease [Gammaproteobacteria bacterium]|nr:MAG: 3'-5' exonuclease [Gammaproteobacteria bacterium]